MDRTKLIMAASKLNDTLGKEELNRIGFETGFAQRLREVTPERLAVSLISGLASQKVETIADLQRSFNALTASAVRYKPFHNQLSKEAFPVFMEGVFTKLLEGTVLTVLEPVPGSALHLLKDLVIQDGSSFGVRDVLETELPGRFTKISTWNGYGVEKPFGLGLSFWRSRRLPVRRRSNRRELARNRPRKGLD